MPWASQLPEGFLPVLASSAWTESETANGWLQESNLALLLTGVLSLWIASVLTYGCCSSYCQKGSFYEPITVSSIAWKRKKDWRMYLNYALLLPLHFIRSMETASGDHNVYSSAEKEFLASRRKVFNDAVVNFLSVRRSMMFVSGLFGLLTLCIQMAEVPRTWEGRQAWIQKSHIEIQGEVVKFEHFVELSGKNWTSKDPEAWFQYSSHLYTGMFAKIISQTALIDVLEALVNVGCQAVSCSYLWWSLRKWSAFRLSHRGVLTGWAFSLLAPFLGTLIPTRLFVEWSVLDPVVHTFAAELSHHLGDHSDEFALTVHNACQQVVDFKESGKAESAERMARKACNALQKTPNRHLKCCSFISVVDFDFRPIHSNCKKIEDYLNQPEGPWHKAALEQAVALCKDTVMPNLKGTIELGFENALQVAASAGPVAQRMKQSVSMGMGFANGLRGFNTIMPAALALAPALLRGALKVKVTAPQSTIPGMFVVVLPLLYCPMTWGMYHIAFQLVGDLWMLLGLLVLAFAPMVYLALGTYYSITRPLTDKAIAKVMVSINRASTILAIIGYVFICTFAWKRYQLTMGDSSEPADQNSVERDAYKYIVQQVAVLQPSFWLQLAGVALAKYFFTTLAGVDWMMVEIGKQRHYENLLEIAQKIRDLEASGAAVRYPPGLRTEEEREENLMAAEERGMRLDCVFYILFDEVPMHVMEEEAPITVTGRGRRTTVLQPAVSGLLEVEMENLQEEDNEVPKAAPAALPGPPPAAPVVSSSPYLSPNEHEESGLTSAFNFFFGLRVPGHDTPGARPLRSVSTAAPSAAAPWQMPPATAGPPFEAGRLPPAHWQTAPPSPRGQLWPAPPPPAWGRHTVAPGAPGAPGARPWRPHF